MKAKCKKCGMKITVGENGIVNPADNKSHLCDGCAGITRDRKGYAIGPADRDRGYGLYLNIATGKTKKRKYR